MDVCWQGLWVAVSGLVIAGCTGTERDNAMGSATGIGTGIPGADDPDEPGATDGSSSSDGDDGGGTDDGSDTSSIKLDVGAPGDTDGVDCPEGNCDEGCTAVDLLFIVDNSVSMTDYQVALSQAFPSFADAIIEELPEGTNLHVAVTSTTMGMSNSGSTLNCTATGDNGAPSESFYQTPDSAPNSVPGAQGRLYPAGGQTFYEIDTDASPAEVQGLKDWFAQAAQIGESGSQIEMSAAPAGWMADPANSATNDGFLRDEGAVLVLFVIQDEPDQTPTDQAQLVVQKISDAKAGCGGMDCVVGGGYVNEFCMGTTPLGMLFSAFGSPAVTATLPPENTLTPQSFDAVLRDTLAQVIGEKCSQIEPPA